MYNLLCPGLNVRSLYDINLDELKSLGIKGFIFDLDNTLVAWDSSEINPAILDWLEKVHTLGFKIVLVSNNHRKRVKDAAAILDVPFVSRALKPIKSGFRQALSIMELSAKEVAVVGDQLFTDVLGGNRLGMFTIWVDSLSNREFVGTRITRQFEKIAVKILKVKGLLK